VNIDKKSKILALLENWLEKLEARAERTAEFARAFKDASPSQSGDRYIYEREAEQAQESLQQLRALIEEILSASNESLSSAEPVSYVTITYDNGESMELLFVENSVGLVFDELLMLTPHSPLGQSILGKQIGDRFSYQINHINEATTMAGKITDIA